MYKGFMNKTVYLESLGCEKNLMDAERALGAFVKQGYRVVAEPHQAVVILVNTCGFIASAVEENINRLVELAQYKKIGRCSYLIVTGCLPQRYTTELPEELPEVDLFLGTRDYEKILYAISCINANAPIDNRVLVSAPVLRKDRGYLQALDWEDSLPRIPTGLTHTSYLKISEGCNKRCTFCAIPGIRGDLVSRPIPSILNEAKMLRAHGLQEIHLIAQDLNDYGIDDPEKGKLETVIETLLHETDIPWIRLHYLYPDRISDQLLNLIAHEPRICGYMDMPIQHISNKILRRMGRTYRKSELMALLTHMYEKIPHLSLRTTLMVGFPGETQEEFQELLEFIEAGWVENLGVFTYFHESGTPSHKFEDDIPLKEKKRRKQELERLQSRVFEKKAREKYLRKVHQVIIDGYHPETPLLLKARMATQAYGVDTHIIINEGEAAVGALVPATITDLNRGQLIGRIESIM